MVSGGVEFYIRNLLDALFKIDRSNEYVLFTNQDNHCTFAGGQPNVQWVLCGVGARPQWKRVAWEQLILPSFAKKYRLDLLHSPTYTWPVRSNLPGVVSILDMLYRVYPETIPRTKLTFWKAFVPWSARRCHKILTSSESSKRDIVRYLGVPPEKVTVTPLALDRQLDTREATFGRRNRRGLRKIRNPEPLSPRRGWCRTAQEPRLFGQGAGNPAWADCHEGIDIGDNGE